MGDKFRLTPEFEIDLVAMHPDAPVCSTRTMSAITGKSEAWIIWQWKNGPLHAYEWGTNPVDPSDAGRLGKKICLQTHADTAMACKNMVDAQTNSNWQANAARLNANKPGADSTACGGGTCYVQPSAKLLKSDCAVPPSRLPSSGFMR